MMKQSLTVTLFKLLYQASSRADFCIDFSSQKNNDKVCLHKMYHIARKNKLEYLFLHSLSDCLKNDFPELFKRYEFLHTLYSKHLQSIAQTSKLLDEAGIKHLFIKTLHKFPALPSDIDILVNSVEDRHAAVAHLEREGYEKFDEGPHFSTLYNRNLDDALLKSRTLREKAPYDIDIYDEICLNVFVYIDKSFLVKTNSITEVSYGSSIIYKVPVLKPEYEVLIKLNHSLFEQLLTLLDVLDFAMFLVEASKIELSNFIRLIRMSGSLTLARVVLKLIYPYLSILDQRCIEAKAKLMLNALNEDFNSYLIEFPHRFSIYSVALSTLEKLITPVMLLKTVKGLPKIFNIQAMNHVIEHLVIRRLRESY